MNKWTMFLALVALPLSPGSALAGDPPEPMRGFDRLVGGCWRLEATCQEFRWGLDGRHLISRSVVRSDSGEQVVSEGAWFYHPEARAAVGYFVARGMGVELFEYRTRFEGEVMVSRVAAWGSDGVRQDYEERWTFTDRDHYLWELFEATESGPSRVMHGTFEREATEGAAE